jgi:hypothetical protein
MTMTIESGQTWTRVRGFRPPDYGRVKWWLVGVTQDGATASGTEYVLIEDVVTSKTGDIVVYRHWVEDPDGVEVQNDWTPRHSELLRRPVCSLASALRTMKMTPGGAVESAEPLPAVESPKPAKHHSATVIAFPTDRIVRRVEHGAPVVAQPDTVRLAPQSAA